MRKKEESEREKRERKQSNTLDHHPVLVQHADIELDRRLVPRLDQAVGHRALSRDVQLNLLVFFVFHCTRYYLTITQTSRITHATPLPRR